MCIWKSGEGVLVIKEGREKGLLKLPEDHSISYESAIIIICLCLGIRSCQEADMVGYSFYRRSISISASGMFPASEWGN